MRYAFGPFALDTTARQLTREGVAIALSDRQFATLHQLISAAGQVCTKEQLIDAVWGDVAVTPNSLEQVVSGLRRALGDTSDGSGFIQTVPRKGYRFDSPVDRRREADGAPADALLAPHRLWLQARSGLDTFELANVTTAIAAFQRVLDVSPDHAPAHVGLANAYAFVFESTRAAHTADGEPLASALRHAREACRLAVDYGEAWATLSFVLNGLGDREEARAAALRAISLEPDNWRHLVRMAWVSWGEERIRFAARALQHLPGLALAHWLTATVQIARQAFTSAERELDAGLALRGSVGDRFQPVGLHWLHGLVLLRRGAGAEAEAAFAQELSAAPGHVYGRECGANTWYALGALHLRRGDRPGAKAAWDRALQFLPGHPSALAAIVELCDVRERPGLEARFEGRLDELQRTGQLVDAALARAVRQTLSGRDGEAARLLASALASRDPDNAGWTIPVDPLLNVAGHPAAWTAVLAALSRRAA